MKVIKGISLFFIYPMAMLLLGFWGGVESVRFFYPGADGLDGMAGIRHRTMQERDGATATAPAEGEALDVNGYKAEGGDVLKLAGTAEESAAASTVEAQEQEVKPVAVRPERLSVETEYVLLETDILRNTEVETTWRLPNKYVGMDRERFLTAMENYSNYPPLSEKERGFVNLEVLSFSRERVVIRMNYRYVQPGEGFYLAVQDNEVVVYLEDKETVYINTGILLDTLPEDLQLQIMQMFYVDGERELYSFLETYSS